MIEEHVDEEPYLLSHLESIDKQILLNNEELKDCLKNILEECNFITTEPSNSVIDAVKKIVDNNLIVKCSNCHIESSRFDNVLKETIDFYKTNSGSAKSIIDDLIILQSFEGINLPIFNKTSDANSTVVGTFNGPFKLFDELSNHLSRHFWHELKIQLNSNTKNDYIIEQNLKYLMSFSSNDDVISKYRRLRTEMLEAAFKSIIEEFNNISSSSKKLSKVYKLMEEIDYILLFKVFLMLFDDFNLFERLNIFNEKSILLKYLSSVYFEIIIDMMSTISTQIFKQKCVRSDDSKNISTVKSKSSNLDDFKSIFIYEDQMDGLNLDLLIKFVYMLAKFEQKVLLLFYGYDFLKRKHCKNPILNIKGVLRANNADTDNFHPVEFPIHNRCEEICFEWRRIFYGIGGQLANQLLRDFDYLVHTSIEKEYSFLKKNKKFISDNIEYDENKNFVVTKAVHSIYTAIMESKNFIDLSSDCNLSAIRLNFVESLECSFTLLKLHYQQINDEFLSTLCLKDHGLIISSLYLLSTLFPEVEQIFNDEEKSKFETLRNNIERMIDEQIELYVCDSYQNFIFNFKDVIIKDGQQHQCSNTISGDLKELLESKFFDLPRILMKKCVKSLLAKTLTSLASYVSNTKLLQAIKTDIYFENIMQFLSSVGEILFYISENIRELIFPQMSDGEIYVIHNNAYIVLCSISIITCPIHHLHKFYMDDESKSIEIENSNYLWLNYIHPEYRLEQASMSMKLEPNVELYFLLRLIVVDSANSNHLLLNALLTNDYYILKLLVGDITSLIASNKDSTILNENNLYSIFYDFIEIILYFSTRKFPFAIADIFIPIIEKYDYNNSQLIYMKILNHILKKKIISIMEADMFQFFEYVNYQKFETPLMQLIFDRLPCGCKSNRIHDEKKDFDEILICTIDSIIYNLLLNLHSLPFCVRIFMKRIAYIKIDKTNLNGSGDLFIINKLFAQLMKDAISCEDFNQIFGCYENTREKFCLLSTKLFSVMTDNHDNQFVGYDDKFKNIQKNLKAIEDHFTNDIFESCNQNEGHFFDNNYIHINEYFKHQAVLMSDNLIGEKRLHAISNFILLNKSWILKHLKFDTSNDFNILKFDQDDVAKQKSSKIIDCSYQNPETIDWLKLLGITSPRLNRHHLKNLISNRSDALDNQMIEDIKSKLSIAK